MPYREHVVAGANGSAIAEEMRLELDTALAAHPAWTKVTSAYTGAQSTWSFDVWQNNGAADGYPWFLVVARASSYGLTYLGGMLEYDPATWTAKKALRGYSGAGYVDADGYPLVAAGGAEMTFPLHLFNLTTSALTGQLGGSDSGDAGPVTGGWLRTLVTDRLAWQGYGATTALTYCHGVGTYQNVHSTTADLRPLANMGCSATQGATSVWQHPAGTGPYVRMIDGNGKTSWIGTAVSGLFGQVGGDMDLLYGGAVGSRFGLFREVNSSKETSTALDYDLDGGFLGIAPDDLLIFPRTSAVALGDTITVGTRTYVSVCAAGTVAGLFVNTTPEV